MNKKVQWYGLPSKAVIDFNVTPSSIVVLFIPPEGGVTMIMRNRVVYSAPGFDNQGPIVQRTISANP